MKIFNKRIDIYSNQIKFLDNVFSIHAWPFQLEDKFVFVDTLEEADMFVYHLYNESFKHDISLFKKLLPSIILKIPGYNISKIGLNLQIFHIDDHMETTYYLNSRQHWSLPNTIIMHTNYTAKTDSTITPAIIYYDSIFNRQKLFCTEYHRVYKFKERLRRNAGMHFVWTMFSTEKTYALSKIEKKFSKDSKLILFTGLTYQLTITYPPARMLYRFNLKNYLKNRYSDISFISEIGKRFLPNDCNEDIANALVSCDGGGGSGFWYPVADDYYNNSLVSIYVETLVGYKNAGPGPGQCQKPSGAKMVTEKTFDPLIKGNFILPFAYQGFLKDVLSYGFLLPDFIDYSYDDEPIQETRFQKYLISIDRLANRTDIRECYERNKHILEHNRNIFYTRPYDTMYDKILKYKNSPDCIRNLGKSVL